MRNLNPPLPDTETVGSLGVRGSGQRRPREEVFGRGSRLGRYMVLESLGSGGMGTVYAAYDPELDRKVALKVLRGELLVSQERDEAQSRLLLEARLAARLAHPNVVSVHDVGTVGERPFVAMELIEGETLSAWLGREKRSWRGVLQVFEQAGRGLEAAHQAGLVHRDFKPGNVMVSRDGRIRVLDFGLARTVDAAPAAVSEARPSTGAGRPFGRAKRSAVRSGAAHGVAGTAAYMAPEQFLFGGADARSDQFGFATALFEALFGAPPFAGSTLEERLEEMRAGRVREQEPESRAPARLRRVLMRALAFDPAARYPALGDLLAELSDEQGRRRRRWLGAGAATTLVVAITAFGFVRGQNAGDRPCQGAERRLDGIWDEGQKRAARESFLATGLPYAEDAWSRTRAVLDRYAREWSSSHREACESTHLRGEQSVQMLDLQMLCLDNRLYELQALTELLKRADREIVLSAAPAAGRLSSLAECRERRRLTGALPPPAIADQVGSIRSRIAEAKVLERTGAYAAALVAAEEALDSSRRLDHPPLVSEALMTFGELQGRLGGRQEMRGTLVEAAAIAQGAGHDEVLARSLSLLIVAAARVNKLDEAHLWSTMATGAIERLGRPPELEYLRHMMTGMLFDVEGSYAEALAEYRSLLELPLELTPLDRVATLNNIGSALLGLGEYAAAIENLEQGLADAETVYGSRHPVLSVLNSNLGGVLLEQEAHAAALEHFRRAQEIDRVTLPGASSDRVQTLLGTGRALIGLGRPAEAIAPLERAVELGAAGDADPLDLALGQHHLSRALWSAKRDPQRARRLAGQAWQTVQGLGERARMARKEMTAWLSERGWME